jgi:hypothetical protein
MATRRMLDHDPESRTTIYHSYDHHTKVTEIETVQDIEPYLKQNRAEYNHDPGGGGGLNDRSRRQITPGWWHVASIPESLVKHIALKDGIDIENMNDDQYKFIAKKYLNNPEYRYLRTNPGKL